VGKNNIMKKLLFILLLQSTLSFAASYDCKVTRKVGANDIVSERDLEKSKYSVKIYDTNKPELERCSFISSKNTVTCDKYPVNKVETDKYVGIKKFYYFTGQFDVQLFPDMQFVENNGRGVIAYGKCERFN
jgi:hypothetical protein